MSQASAKSFLMMLEKSGIVEKDELKPALKSFKEKTKAAGLPVSTDSLTAHLIETGLITQWHTDKLLAGKYKGFFLGKYKLLRHLGSGGMSSVYLARHTISDQLRAIKVLPKKKVDDKSYLDRFYLEARAAASLNHPNVVRIYDICHEGKTHYMVMEYVKGHDLSEVLAADGPLSFRHAAKYLIDAAEGLKHAHERELVHRDIKPANLLLTEQGSVKILDLGLALVNQDDTESLTVLYNEKVMGTADYLSPEQAVNSHHVDLRADIYSMGCTLYFLLSGHPPFPDGTLAQRIAKHQTENPVDIRRLRIGCPDTLARICNRMMEKDPDDRFQSCAEVKAALKKFLLDGKFDESIELRPRGEALKDGGDPVPVAAKATPSASGVPQIQIGTTEVSAANAERIVRRRVRRKVPVWVLPVTIAGMFLILVGVLMVLAQTLK